MSEKRVTPPPFVFEPRVKDDPVRWGIDTARRIGEAFQLDAACNIDDGAKLAELAAVLTGFAVVANAVRKPKRKEK